MNNKNVLRNPTHDDEKGMLIMMHNNPQKGSVFPTVLYLCVSLIRSPVVAFASTLQDDDEDDDDDEEAATFYSIHESYVT